MAKLKGYEKYITLNRGFDWDLRSNKFVLLFTAFTFLVFFTYSLVFVTQDLLAITNIVLATEAALLSFFTWAIAREFDPDDPLTAISAQVLVSIAIFWFFPELKPLLLALLVVLFGSRIINRITGVESTIWDTLLVTFFGIGASLLTMNWVYALITAFALIADTLYKKENILNYLFAVGAVGVSMYLIFTENVYRYVIYLPPLLEYLLLFMLVVTILVRFFMRNRFEVKNDRGKSIDRKRVLTGSAFIMISLLFITIFGGEDFYVTASPLWAIVVVYPFVGVLNRE